MFSERARRNQSRACSPTPAQLESRIRDADAQAYARETIQRTSEGEDSGHSHSGHVPVWGATVVEGNRGSGKSAAADTGHPVLFKTSGTSEDAPRYLLEASSPIDFLRSP